MKNINKQNGFTLFQLTIVSVCLAGAIGWVLNIYKLMSFDGTLGDFTVVEFLQFVGIIVAPLGAVLGYLV